MGENEKIPVLHLELHAGVFRIKTNEAIYEITVKPENGLTQIVEKIVEREIIVEKPVPAPSPPVEHKKDLVEVLAAPSDTDTFYKEISEELYHEIGQLARQLAITIKTPLDDDDLQNIDLGKAGVDLESAKGQLQDIVKMTEKATMDIMDISEDIQDSCDIIKNNLSAIKDLHFIEKTDQREAPGVLSPDTAVVSFLDNLVKKEIHIKECLLKLPLIQEKTDTSDAPTEVKTERVKVYKFDLDVVFQTLYELCTNETVKKSHLKPMREEQHEAFDVEAVLQAFSELGATVPVEETFYNFPLPGILKILFQHAKSDKHKQTLKKIHQSSATIFLDQTIPIEGTVVEKDVIVQNAPQSAPSETRSGTELLQGILTLIDDNIGLLQAEIGRLHEASVAVDRPGYAMMQQSDHKKLISAIESTDSVIHKIITNISRILEALSFQDLSGQRIKKILSMLSNVQVQLLSILVSFGTKMKKKEEEKDITAHETEAIANKEVDRMKSLVSEPINETDEWGGPLNQNAVDKLLADLGF